MTNTLFTGDNLFILNGLNSQSVDLIYLDPPFNSKRFYSAPVGSKSAGASFSDMWSWADVNEFYLETLISDYPFMTSFIETIKGVHSKAMMAYITYMTQRLIQMHRILKDTGSFYLHCDPTAGHYLKIILDRIFGKNNFRNEIVWHYGTGGIGKRTFAKKHDTIFFYSKSKDYTFNQPRMPSKDPKRFNKVDEDGRPYYEKAGNKYYLDKGVAVPNVWLDIYPVRNVSKERLGYPTQKPLSLMHRIIKASSNEGDIVMDPFCGCATTCVAAQQLQRKWIGIDIEKKSVDVLIERLSDDAGLFKDFIHRTDIPKRTDIKTIQPDNKDIKHKLYKKQKKLCNGCSVEFQIINLEVDHIIPKSKGGANIYENYQLLCGTCNRIKGNRPMEYLRMKIRKRQDILQNNITFGE
jgi:DNA modification methylase